MPTPADVNSPLSTDALEAAVRGADPTARVLPPWLLQKIIAHDTGATTGVFALSRAKAHVIARGRLLDIVQREELPVDALPDGAPTLILLARPEADVQAYTPAPELLLQYWRLLFHARAKTAVATAIAADPLPRAAVQRRVERLGRPLFNEARFVLMRERYLPTWADDAAVYAEFAALYLELTHFNPEPLAWFFPAIEDPMSVLRVLAEDVDAESLRKATRPAGAADPHADFVAAPANGQVIPKRPARTRRDAAHREKLLAVAGRADARGNDVRAAIFRMRVYRASGGTTGANNATVYADALRDLDQLAARLKAALRLDDPAARQWRAWLVALLENAASGWWNAEGRLLYDLQKACVYHEREIYSVNVIDYLVERGKRPLRRPQPGQRLVLTLKSLRSALRRAAKVRLSPHGRSELARLIRAAIHDAEDRLRTFLRPPVTTALDEAGLHPESPTESVAHAKLTEELLDEVVDGGYLTFGALRDAVSRNQMKLDDLTKVGDLAYGDQLLRADRRLEDKLDYVYRHGEVYLRGFHRLSALFFATDAGRLITRALLLPFGGAFLILEALDHSVGLLIHKLAANQYVVTAAAASATHAFGPTPVTAATPAAEQNKLFNQWWLFLLLGAFLWALINAPAFRRAVVRGLRRAFRAARALVIDLPRWLVTQPLVKAVLRSHFARLLWRYVAKPLAAAALVYVLLPPTMTQRHRMFTFAGVFMGVNVLINSRAGRSIEQWLLHALRTTFARLTWDVLASLLRRIVQVFQGLLEAIDRLLYAVDELLRFRAGQRKSTVVIKAILGVFWFYIAYLTRFIINLLVEPQINPIKHFPVVTVSHKMILPTTPYLSAAFQRIGIESGAAWTTAGLITLCSPGIFGFLAWEFKENWKLYKANRSQSLKPVRAGSHGESVAQFLRPGLHSGTIPKIFHKLRKASVDASATPKARHLEAAHHVRHALVAFFDREFIALLNQHPLFRETPVSLGNVHLASTLIRVEFDLRTHDTALAATPLTLSFEQRAAWIIAGVDDAGWTSDLSSDRTRLIAAALLGLYKMAGADLVREHVQSLFPEGTRFDFRQNDLVVWPKSDFTTQAAYPLTHDGPLTPTYTSDSSIGGPPLPTLAPEDLLFRKVPLPRTAWIALWQSPTTEGATADLPSVHVLPPARPAAAPAPLFEVRATSP